MKRCRAGQGAGAFDRYAIIQPRLKRSDDSKPWLWSSAFILCVLLVLAASVPGRFAPEPARAADARIAITTDKSIYQPGDTVSFNVLVDSGGQQLGGELLIDVYPAASFLSDKAFTGEPLSEGAVKSGLSLTGQESFTYEQSVDDLKAGPGGFPVKVKLVSDGTEVLSGKTWLAVVEPGSHEPLDLALLWTVGGTPQRGPDGVFTGLGELDRCRATPRTTDTLLQHLELANKYPNIKTVYAIDGILLDELTDMSDGFRVADANGTREVPAGAPEAVNAGSCLESLRSMAKSDSVEILATPYAFTSLPILARDGWDDGNGQFRIGHDVVTEVLDLPGVPQGAFIPGLDLTTDSLRYISATGGDYAVLAGLLRQYVAGSLPMDAVTYRLRDLGGERITSFFAHDDASISLFGDPADPAAFWAAMANAYVSPPPGRLVIAASFVPNPVMSADQRDRLYAEIAAQGWIIPITLSQAQELHRPGTQPMTLQRYVDPLSGYVAGAYYDKLAEAHGLFEDYRLAVDNDEPELLRLVKNMYTAESLYFLRPSATPDEANQGLSYINKVTDFVRQELGGLHVSVSVPRLQQTADAEAVITVTNDRLYPFNVDLALAGDGVEFPEGDTQKLRLKTGDTEVRVPYSSPGWSRVEAEIMSNGHSLTGDSAGVHPVTTRVWIVAIVTVLALIGGILYVLLVVRRRS